MIDDHTLAKPVAPAESGGFTLPVWLAAGVKTRDDIRSAEKAAGPADLLLLDAKARGKEWLLAIGG